MDALEINKLKLLNEQIESLTKTGTWELDLSSQKFSWSDGVYQMLGYKPQEFEITFDKGIEVIHPQDRERVTVLLEDVLQNKATYFIEERLISKAGNIVHVRSKANLFKDEEGKPIKLIGVFQDITEFVTSQEQLLEKKSLTQDIITNLPSAFFLFNKKGQMLLWNKEFEEISSYSKSEIASLTPTDFFSGKEKQKIKHHIKEALENGYTELEAWLTTKENAEVPLYVTASNIQHEGERCVFGTGTDISQRLSLLHELELLISNTDEAFMYIDQDLNVVSYNKQMEVHYKFVFQKELKKGFKLKQLVKEEQKEELDQIIKQVWDKKEAKVVLKTTLDGEKKYYELKFKPILSEEKKVNGIFLTSLNVTETHIANIELKKSQQKLQHVLDSSLDTICTIDGNGIFQMVSRSSEQLWGYKPEELIGKPYMDYVIKEERKITLKVVKDMMKGKKFTDFENHYRHKNGKKVPVVWSGHWDEEQKLLHCVARDATEKRIAEEKLKFSERRFKALVQEGSDLIAIMDLEGNHKYASPNYRTILGIEPEGLLGNDAFALVHPEDRNRVYTEFGKLEKEKHVLLSPYRFRDGKGEWRWLESSISNMLDEPSVQGIVSNSRDITERIKIEKDIKESKERLELVMMAGSESIWDYDAVRDELFLGKGYLKNYGVTSLKSLSNMEIHDALVHPDDFETFKPRIVNALADPKITEWTDNYRFKKKDGNYAYVEDRAIIVRDDKGKALRAVGAIKDVSHQVLNERLDEREKALMEESITAKVPIRKLLGDYLTGIDALFRGMKTSILAVSNNKLKNLSSPGLSEVYLEEIQNFAVGPNQGSCGTAAYLKKQVVVKDIFDDERWEDFTDLGQKYGFRSCWSEPIFNSKGEVIATFAIYHDEVKEPKDLEINIFERGSRLISMMLQNFAYIKNIKQNNKRFKLINKATNNAIYDWDITNDHFHWGDSLMRVFGHNIHKEKFRLKDWATWVHPDDLDGVLQSLDGVLTNREESKWSAEYRFRYSNGKYAHVEEVAYLLRNKHGQPTRMIGALRDQTLIKQEQIKQELQYEVSQFFKKEMSLDETLKESIKYLTQRGTFLTGEIWLMSHNEEVLYLSAWYAKEDKAEFYKDNSIKSFKYGEGLPGAVWEKRKNEVWNDIERKPEFARQKVAQKSKLKSATAYPLFYREKIVGVLVLFSADRLKTHDQHVLSYNNLTHYLGAEIMRKQQEEELNLFFESAPEILAIASPTGYFVKVNPSFCDLLGYTEDELTSTPLSHFVHPDDLEKTTEEFDETITGKRHADNFINRYRAKDGRYKWISWFSSEAFGQEGFVFAYGRNVSEMIALQETIKNATKLSLVGGWEIDFVDNEVFWSPMTKKIHGVPEDFSPTLEKAIDFYHPEHREEATRHVNNAIENGGLFDFEARIITAKKHERWVRAIGKAEFEDNKCIRLYGSFQDVHERKVTELRLKNISNNIPGVIFQYHLKPNGEDLLDFVSKGSEEIFGFSPEECMKSTEIIWGNIEAGGDMPQMQESIMKSSKDLSKWHALWRYQHPDGNLYWHEGFGNPVKQQDGTIIWDSIIVDITEKKKVEEQIKLANMALEKHTHDLEMSNAELEQFAYVASHDLQEPLRMVTGFLTQLEKKYGDQLDEKANQYIDFAVDGAKRMRQIILDLLDYSRAGKKEEEVTEIDLNEIIHEVCMLHRKKVEELGANIEFRGLPKIFEHPTPMTQIFSNLISNALKYSNPDIPPKIVIKATELNNEWKFSVKDNGIGIEEEHYDRVFNIFQRLHNKEEYSGTGMGLAIVKKIIENKNGKIWIKSTLGKGTTFYFTIPKI